MADEIDIIKEGKKAIEKMQKAREEIEKRLIKGMEKGLLTIERDAKINCNINEGRLRASITHAIESKNDEVVGRVGSNLEYAPYAHEGTGIYATRGDGRKDIPWKYQDINGDWYSTEGQEPNPFLRDAMDSNKDKLGEIFKETMEGLK